MKLPICPKCKRPAPMHSSSTGLCWCCAVPHRSF